MNFKNLQICFYNKNRLTDLCEYCEKEIFFKKKIAQILQDHNYEYESEYNILKIRKQFYYKALDLKK